MTAASMLSPMLSLVMTVLSALRRGAYRLVIHVAAAFASWIHAMLESSHGSAAKSQGLSELSILL